MTKNMVSIVFFVWDDLLDYQILLAKNLKAAGAGVTMIVQTNEGGAKCYANELPFVITDNIYKYFKISEKIARWWTCAAKLDLTKISYRQTALFKLCKYEQTIQKNEKKPAGLEKHIIRAAESIEFFHHIADNLHPDILFVWNGLSLPTRAFKEFAKTLNIQVYCLERGFFPETLFIDSGGVNFGSCFSELWNGTKNELTLKKSEEEIITDYFQEIHRQAKSITVPESKMSSEDIYKCFGISGGKKIILYAAQIDIDTNIVFYSPNYNNNKDLIIKLEKIISKYRNAYLLIKLHPEDINRKNEFGKLLSNNSAIVDNISIQSLLQAVDIVVVRNSTVGLEALTYFKPVITLGSAIYSHKGLTYDVSTDEELGKELEFLIRGGHNISEARSRIAPFLFSLLNSCLYFINGQEVFKGSNKKIEQNCLKRPNIINRGYIKKTKPDVPFSVRLQNSLQKNISRKYTCAGRTQNSKEKQNVLIIIYNINLPYKILLNHLSSISQRVGAITVIGNKLLEKEHLACNCFYPFTIFNMLKCFFKPYDLLVFASFCSLNLKTLMYLLFCRSKKKMLLNPFNLNEFFKT